MRRKRDAQEGTGRRKEPRREGKNRKNDECSSCLGNQEEKESRRKALRKKGRKKERKKERKKKNLDHPATLFLGKGCRRARTHAHAAFLQQGASRRVGIAGTYPRPASAS